MQSRKGQSIEDASMQVIEREIGSHSYNKKEWPIVRRVIHSTADFDFAMENSIIFHKEAIENGLKALKSGCNIVVDVNGVAGLLNKQNTKKFGNNVICRISDPEITRQVQESNKTRSQMSMRMSSSDIDEGLVVIGNAPTALFEVIQMVKEDITSPALIVGMPVGFISAAESKEELRKVDIPFITNKGRKGGSSSAAAIVNALFKMIE
ncbi:MAG: Cobalt-precorrin-8 methylmutase [Nitrosopumilales archaeon]|nr:MAG: Cobalt-precorrin-8 methylmutase [Nitrosopumilales archaeon]